MSDEDASTTAEAPGEADETTEPSEPDSQEEPDEKDEKWDPERAKRKIAKLNSEAANLRKRLNETPKVDDVAAKDTRISSLETENLRLAVALDLGLPKEIASRLQGKDRDEMVADAETLLELIAPAKQPSTRKPKEALRGGQDPEQEPEETDLKKLGERMFRS